MPFDRQLSDWIRIALSGRDGVSEKPMFGDMCCGVHREELMVRLDPATTEDALAQPHTRVFNLTGRRMDGWILVAPDGVSAQDEVAYRVERGFAYASRLPSK